VTRRVVVTGMAGITALGDEWKTIEPALRARRNAVRAMHEWAWMHELQSKLAAPADHFTAPPHYPRKTVRSMGRVALMSVRASEVALAHAGLLDDAELKGGRAGIAYGSSSGSVEPLKGFGTLLTTGSMADLTSTSYIQMMSHTAAVNIGLYFGLKGRVIPTSSACTSASQAIGFGFEAIRWGKQDVMVAGGSDELSPTHGAVFDTLFATSQKNDSPDSTPRPFDRDRDGLVVGEGAATLILEEREHALARGARIHAEIVGFGCNSDGAHITQPEAGTMGGAMRLALEDAALAPEAIGWVNAHGTATDRGDVAETQATRAVFGRAIPISALKSYFGHTLGACGGIEAWLGIEMNRDGWISPTINLAHVDPRCADLDYVVGEGRQMSSEYFMSNNFAFGGINTSLIFRQPG
jgi:3-oxoacyl-[acyl-carrier-protein] synthase II